MFIPNHQRGEIATILAISALVILGVTTVASSFFVNKNQTTTTTRASGFQGVCSAFNDSNVPKPDGFKWVAHCGAQFQCNDPNHTDCQSKFPGKAVWCYGFDGPNKSKADWRCLSLESAGTQTQPTSPVQQGQPINNPVANPQQPAQPQPIVSQQPPPQAANCLTTEGLPPNPPQPNCAAGKIVAKDNYYWRIQSCRMSNCTASGSNEWCYGFADGIGKMQLVSQEPIPEACKSTIQVMTGVASAPPTNNSAPVQPPDTTGNNQPSNSNTGGGTQPQQTAPTTRKEPTSTPVPSRTNPQPGTKPLCEQKDGFCSDVCEGDYMRSGDVPMNNSCNTGTCCVKKAGTGSTQKTCPSDAPYQDLASCQNSRQAKEETGSCQQNLQSGCYMFVKNSNVAGPVTSAPTAAPASAQTQCKVETCTFPNSTIKYVTKCLNTLSNGQCERGKLQYFQNMANCERKPDPVQLNLATGGIKKWCDVQPRNVTFRLHIQIHKGQIDHEYHQNNSFKIRRWVERDGTWDYYDFGNDTFTLGELQANNYKISRSYTWSLNYDDIKGENQDSFALTYLLRGRNVTSTVTFGSADINWNTNTVDLYLKIQ